MKTGPLANDLALFPVEVAPLPGSQETRCGHGSARASAYGPGKDVPALETELAWRLR